MMNKIVRHEFFLSAAWSWFMFGIAAVSIEFFRPSFVDFLMPIWVPFVVAAVCGIIALKK